ncbi:tetratricopeptide repeat protein [Vibrio sp. 10N.261.51.F12]|uniref:tetratricopeptide repeat protein n=1 Tax=Vibrio sp. 10N.261.51.F12 TaxID=3229679 RepID=UPI00354E3375
MFNKLIYMLLAFCVILSGAYCVISDEDHLNAVNLDCNTTVIDCNTTVIGCGAPNCASHKKEITDATIVLTNAYNGHQKAQIKLANMYLQGNNVEQNSTKAAHWFQVAADAGNPEAQTQLALLFASGNGVAQNYKKAVSWLGKAANQNYLPALDLLHWMSQAAH